ncbi:MAG: hypothetical protein ACPGNV_00025 [Mangrovicoccus sp.]
MALGTGTQEVTPHASYASGPTMPGSAWVWDADGFQNYETVVFGFSFDLTGYDPTTASLSGHWAADNYGFIRLNGVEIAQLPNFNSTSFSQMNSYLALGQGQFMPGINHVSYEITNQTYNAGLRATAMVTAAEIPLPNSLLFLGSAAGALFIFRGKSR